MEDWRQIPAEIVEEIITQHIGHFPPSKEELVALLERHRYSVQFAPAYSGEQAQSYHQARRIVIPHGRPDWTLATLLHETAEALLRLPVAPEFAFVPTGADEYHNVATRTVDRIVDRIAAERTHLLEQEVKEELAVFTLCEEIRRLNAEMERAISALRSGDLTARLPETGNLHLHASALSMHTERLKTIQARLRFF